MNKVTTLVIDDMDFKKLKSILALRGVSISSWIRSKIREEISKPQ